MRVLKRLQKVMIGFLCILLLSGCMQQGNQDVQAESDCKKVLEQVYEQVSDSVRCNRLYSYEEKDYSTYFEYWYNLPVRFVSDGAIYMVEGEGNADEITILYPGSSVTYDVVKEALMNKPQYRSEQVLSKEESARALEKGTFAEKDGYLLFVIADDPQPIVEAFEQVVGSLE